MYLSLLLDLFDHNLKKWLVLSFALSLKKFSSFEFSIPPTHVFFCFNLFSETISSYFFKSNPMFFSDKIFFVTSTGKPYVSYNLNAVSGEKSLN